MVTLVNRAKMTTATTGTGDITLGSAVDGYQSFSAAGIADGDIVRYVIEDGSNWEIGQGTYTATGTTLTRTVLESSNADAAISLSGTAQVFIGAAGEDIQQPPSEGAFVDGDKTKLDGIEANADVTDTINVQAAGALMDSEVTNLAQVKTFNSADYATAAQGNLADTATQPGDNISTLTNDAGYTTNVGDITGVTAGTGLTGGGASGNVTLNVSGLTVSEFAGAAIQTSAESFTDNDTSLMTSGAVADYVAANGGASALVDLSDVVEPNQGLGVGSNALSSDVSSFGRNHAFGTSAGRFITTGKYNTCVGFYAGDGDVGGATGSYNIAIGQASLPNFTTGSNNVALGTGSSLTSGSENVMIAPAAGTYLTTATGCVFIGRYAGFGDATNKLTGSDNIGIGRTTLYSLNTGHSNVALGEDALHGATSGYRNVGIGFYSGRGTTTGNNNTYFGSYAGDSNTTGSNNTVIGYMADTSSTTVSNEITLGNTSVSTLRCQQTSITALSDARFKENIEDVRPELGLDLIEKVRVVEFDWNERDEGLAGRHQVGVIAQELAQVEDDLGADFLNLTLRENPERLEAAPGQLLLPLIKAVQELSAKNKSLEERLAALEAKQ